jgi:hypothetical protein
LITLHRSGFSKLFSKKIGEIDKRNQYRRLAQNRDRRPDGRRQIIGKLIRPKPAVVFFLKAQNIYFGLEGVR